jgi:hypothetical protein
VTIVLEPRAYRDSFALLRQFDGWRCWWCPVASGIIFGGLYTMPVVGGVGSIYLAHSRSVVVITLGVVAAIMLAEISKRLIRRQPWFAPLGWRFGRYATPNDFSGAVQVLIKEAGYDRACRLLRQAKLCPESGRRTPPPPDAPELDATFSVLPTKAAPTTSDLKADIAQLLVEVGIGGRAGGLEFGRAAYGTPQTTLSERAPAPINDGRNG